MVGRSDTLCTALPLAEFCFYFHGHPGSRFEAGFLSEAQHNLAFVLWASTGPDGAFQLQGRRRLLNWPDDVIELADACVSIVFRLSGSPAGTLRACLCAQVSRSFGGVQHSCRSRPYWSRAFVSLLCGFLGCVAAHARHVSERRAGEKVTG